MRYHFVPPAQREDVTSQVLALQSAFATLQTMSSPVAPIEQAAMGSAHELSPDELHHMQILVTRFREGGKGWHKACSPLLSGRGRSQAGAAVVEGQVWPITIDIPGVSLPSRILTMVTPSSRRGSEDISLLRNSDGLRQLARSKVKLARKLTVVLKCF